MATMLGKLKQHSALKREEESKIPVNSKCMIQRE